jgi:hypothetical protein
VPRRAFSASFGSAAHCAASCGVGGVKLSVNCAKSEEIVSQPAIAAITASAPEAANAILGRMAGAYPIRAACGRGTLTAWPS